MLHTSSVISGTPLRPKAARVEPHTYTKRHAGDFVWSVASGMARGRARRTTVAFYDILT